MAYAGDLTPQEAFDLLRDRPDATLVDVRTRAEWSYVGVPDLGELERDAVLLEWQTYPSGDTDPESFAASLEQSAPDKSAPVIFLCRSGVRSVAAAQVATANGFSQAFNVLEGFEGGPDESGHRGTKAGWKVRGLPWKQS